MKKLIFLIIFFISVTTVQGLEDGSIQDRSRFTLDNTTLVNGIGFCFGYYNNSIACRYIADFDDKNYGLKCDYEAVGKFPNHIKYNVQCEIKKEWESVCPLVFDLGNWSKSIVTDDFEENITLMRLNQSVFALSGINKSLVFIADENYNYGIEKNESVRLLICSKTSRAGNYSYSIQMVAANQEINKFTLHEPIAVLEHPPTITIGPRISITEIKIENLVRGNIFEWHPELPYANLALKFEPINNYNKNESILVKFRGTSGVEESEIIYYDKDKNLWIFPSYETKQVKFDYNSWLFPIDEYKTEIIIENGSLSTTEIQDLNIPESEFLIGLANLNQNKIEVKIFRNQTAYFMLILILFFFYAPLIYLFKIVKTRIPKFIYLVQTIPFGLLFMKDLIPIL